MYSWKSFFCVLVIFVFLVERHSFAIASSSSRVSPNTLQSSDIASDRRSSGHSQDHVIRTFETGLLKMFGLNSRPKPKKKVHIPAYIMELYEQAVQANQEIYSRYDSDELNDDLDSQGHRSSSKFPFAGTTVRGFYHQEKDKRTHHHHQKQKRRRGKRSLPDTQDDHSKVFMFNVSNIGADETLLGAELRLFRQNSTLHQNNKSRSDDNSTNTRDSEHPSPSKYRIGIYEIIRPASDYDEAVSRLIDTRVVDSSRTKWESFDIHSAVVRWRQKPRANHGLQVTITSLDSRPSGGHHVRLRRSLSSSEQHVSQTDGQWAEQQPFMVTYTEDSGAAARRRTKRGARSRHRKRSRSHQRKRKKGECRRHPLYVDFSDVGWDDWIVAPPGYRAYFCNGECGFPLPEYINATNHAIVQTLVHSVNPEAVPRPCCVPTELSPISMLYVDEHDKVTLKNYQDMVVVGCGCR